MTNVYDIVLNLLDSKRVYEAFEWNNKDNLEHIKKIPIYKVDSNTLDDFIYNLVVVNQQFLDEIYQKSEVYSGEKTNIIDYACLFTDDYKVLGVEFNKEGKSLFKSFLLIDEEDEILDISNELSRKIISYKVIKKLKRSNFLTREEEFRRNYLLRELKYAYRKNMYEKINYLYEEVYPKNNKTVEEKYNKLINDIDNNFSSIHNELYKILKLIQSKKKKKYQMANKK